jgi:NAD-dependent deacetylase
MNIFVLTGAGISAESGLGTFRDKAGTGIWARFDPMRLATPEAFASNPEEVHAFYNARRRNFLEAQPNPAHVALAKLRRDWPSVGAVSSFAPRTLTTSMSAPDHLR